MSTVKINEPAREVDVVHETEVLVVGSGPGGLAAALAAARAGADVALVERFGCFGGNLTVVGVEGLPWDRPEHMVEADGIACEFEDRAKEMGAATPDAQSLSYEIDSEGFKVVADRLVEEARVDPCSTACSSRPSCATTRSKASSSSRRPAGRRARPGARAGAGRDGRWSGART